MKTIAFALSLLTSIQISHADPTNGLPQKLCATGVSVLEIFCLSSGHKICSVVDEGQRARQFDLLCGRTNHQPGNRPSPVKIPVCKLTKNSLGTYILQAGNEKRFQTNIGAVDFILESIEEGFCRLPGNGFECKVGHHYFPVSRTCFDKENKLMSINGQFNLRVDSATWTDYQLEYARCVQTSSVPPFNVESESEEGYPNALEGIKAQYRNLISKGICAQPEN